MNQDDLRQARGVLPYPSKDAVMGNPTATGQFVFLVLRPDLDDSGVRDFLGTVQAATEALRAETGPADSRVATVATGFASTFFGSPGSPRFPSLTGIPAGLTAPPAVDSSVGAAADVLCYVVTTSEGVAARFLAEVAKHAAVASLSIERGYQRLDQTEPFGYRDGVRNIPNKADRHDVVYIDRYQLPEEPWWAHDGTYLAYLKIDQHPEVMDALDPPSEQDAAIGRTKAGHRLDASDQEGKPDPRQEGEFTGETPPVDSHVRKTGPRGAAHDTVRIFRRGLPFYEVTGDGKLQVGLHFVSFQASLDAFDIVFNRWMTNPAFPAGGPNKPDRLLAKKLISLRRHGFFFVPPDTNTFGEAMFEATPKSKKPTTGKVAIRKKLIDGAMGGPHKGGLSGFTFRVVDAVGAAMCPDFTTDAKGHALSGDLPVDAPLLLEEISAPANIPVAEPINITLTSSRAVVPVLNTVPGASIY